MTYPPLQVELTLVLNKIDRLILEVQLTPEQAYQRIKAIIEQVNNIVSAFQSEQYISETDAILASHDVSAQTQARWRFDLPPIACIARSSSIGLSGEHQVPL